MTLMTSIGLMATLFQLLTPCLRTHRYAIPPPPPHHVTHNILYSIKRIASHGV